MKVLAIRGSNLASLPELNVDFESGPLADTRIFAITGPTGAGKSTLLDAMCLALYDRVPRLVGQRGRAQEDLSASDPRGILRRGAGEGYAEVDFLGVDGHRYRARWEVWRARRRPEGRLQEPRVELWALDPERSLTEHRRSDTLSAVAARVGLDFPAFRRAVLLAQGDFAAFLSARPDERAELLERLTGTELYADLSRRAFLRAKTEAEALHQLERDAEQARPLPPAEAEALALARGEAARRRAEAEAALAAAEASRTHRRIEAELLEELDAAERERTTARAAAAAISELSDRLRRARRWVRLLPLLRSKQETEAAATRAELEALAAAEAAAVAEERHRGLLEAVRAAAGRRIEKRAARAALEPELVAAAALDAELDRWTAEARAHERARDRAKAERADANAQLERVCQQRAALEAEAEAARAFSAERRWLEELGDGGDLVTRLARLEDHTAALAELDPAPLERERQERAAAVEAAETELARAEAARAASERAARAASSSMALAEQSADPSAFAEARRRFSAVHRAFSLLRADIERSRGGPARAAREVHHQEARLLSAERAFADAADAASAAAAALLAAERAGQLAAGRSELLVPGAPCPLCGSREHPGGPQADDEAQARAEAARANRRKATAALEAATRARAEAAGAAEAARARLSLLADDRRAADATLEQLGRELAEMWLDAPLLHGAGISKVGLLLPKRLPDKREALGPALAQLERVEATLDRMAEEIDRAEASAQSAAERAQAATVEAERAASELRFAQARAEDNRQARQTQDQVRAERSAASGALRAGISAALAAWPEAARLGEPGLAEALSRLLAEARSERERAAARGAKLDHLAALEPELRGRLEARVEAARAAESAEADARARLDAAVHARAQRIGGRPVAEVSAEADGRLTEAEADEERARAAEAEAQRQLAEHRSLAAARRATATANAEAAEEAARAFREASGDESDEGPEDLPGLEAEVHRLEAQVAALSAAVGKAEATFSDREGRLQRHRQAPPPPPPEGSDPEIHRAAVEAENQRLARLDHDLERDTAARAKTAALLPKLDAQRLSADRWGDLSDLIGSADGKKLRGFAQSLSLDGLLDRANHHLGSLRPRYRLRRSSDLDLEVVDGDMGDERRPAASLSGGESFLASLALALALSDLSSRDVRIESLFVDEGFGSLDPDSLEVALSALDQLQAGGRTIGVVSHVPEVAERIGYELRVRPVGPGRSRLELRHP